MGTQEKRNRRQEMNNTVVLVHVLLYAYSRQ